MRRVLLGILCTVGILIGCTDQSKDINELKKQIDQITLEKDALLNTLEDERKALELAINQEVNKDNSMILAKAIETYPQVLYKGKTFDIDGDGEEEIIELYVNVGIMEDGSFAWDDGQNWLLVVKDGEITYPLLDDYIQLGSLDFTVTTFDGKPGIVMHMRQHANITIQKFTYDEKEKAYQKETFYKKENMNDHYNQSASFAFFKDAYELIERAFTGKTLVVLEASEKSLQDKEERSTMIKQVLNDIENAQYLLEVFLELNREQNFSLDGVIDLLYQMVNNPPTAEQMNQLRSIHNVFKEIGKDELNIVGQNQIHPVVKEMFQRLDFILNEKQN